MHSWGRFPTAHAVERAPDTRAGLVAAVRETPGPQIARGMGRSYGDACLIADMDPCGRTERQEKRYRRLLELALEGRAAS